MNVFDAWYELLKVLACLILIKSLVLNDHIEELATLYELHDQIEILLGLDDLINLYNVGMVQLFEDLNLSTNSLDILLLFNSWLFKNFHGNLYQNNCLMVKFEINNHNLQVLYFFYVREL